MKLYPVLNNTMDTSHREVVHAGHGSPPPADHGPATLSQTWAHLLAVVEVIIARLQVREKIRWAHDLALQHPVPAFIVLMVVALCSVPVLIFIIFAVVSVSVTFVSFVCFEGVLLTVGVVALGGSIAVMSILAIVLSGVMLGGACTLLGTQHVMTYLRQHRTTWTRSAQDFYDNCMNRLQSALSLLNSTKPPSDQMSDPTRENHANQHREETDQRAHED